VLLQGQILATPEAVETGREEWKNDEKTCKTLGWEENSENHTYKRKVKLMSFLKKIFGSSRPTVYGYPNTKESAKNNSNDEAEVILIPTGSFLMGGIGGVSEHLQHEVLLDSFYLDKYPVTNAKFEKFVDATGYVTKAEKEGGGEVLIRARISSTLMTEEMSKVPAANWKDPEGAGIGIANRMDHPVVLVSWDDANAYCKWAGCRLPTEAEYEYAIRGGTTTQWFWGEDVSQASYFAWSEENSEKMTHPVGKKKPNPYGLYDIVGNVWEWCSDRWDPKYYVNSPKNNPQGSEKGTLRVLRGGSWNYNRRFLMAAARIGNEPGNCDNMQGFRCARTP